MSVEESKIHPPVYMGKLRSLLFILKYLLIDLKGPRALQRYELQIILWEAREVPVGTDDATGCVYIEACITLCYYYFIFYFYFSLTWL